MAEERNLSVFNSLEEDGGGRRSVWRVKLKYSRTKLEKILDEAGNTAVEGCLANHRPCCFCASLTALPPELQNPRARSPSLRPFEGQGQGNRLCCLNGLTSKLCSVTTYSFSLKSQVVQCFHNPALFAELLEFCLLKPVDISLAQPCISPSFDSLCAGSLASHQPPDGILCFHTVPLVTDSQRVNTIRIGLCLQF